MHTAPLNPRTTFPAKSLLFALSVAGIGLASSNPEKRDNTIFIAPPGFVTVPPSPYTPMPIPQTSSFDWWPYPPQGATSTLTTAPSSTAVTTTTTTSTMISDSTDSSVSPFFANPMNITSQVLTQTSTTSNLSSSSTDTWVHITATALPGPGNLITNPHTFKIVWLTPVFALLGLIGGATFTGMLFNRCSWCRDRQKPKTEDFGFWPWSKKNDDNSDVAYLQSYPYPRTASLQVELGFDPDDEGGLEGEKGYDEGLGLLSPNHPNDTLASPSKYSSIGSPHSFSRAAAIQALSQKLHHIIPSANSPSNSSQKSQITPSLPRRSNRSYLGIGLEAPGDNYHPRHSPDGPSALSKGFQDIPLDDTDSERGAGDVEDDAILARRSHASIRRKIAERLRLGSRRQGASAVFSNRAADEVEIMSGGPTKTGLRSRSGHYRRNSDVLIAPLKDAEKTHPVSSSPHPSSPVDDRHSQPVNANRDVHNVSRKIVQPSRLLPKHTSSPSSSRPGKESPSPRLRPKSRFIKYALPETLPNPLSPPAHPHLFFADPILANFIPNNDEKREREQPAPPKRGGHNRYGAGDKNGESPSTSPGKKLHRKKGNSPLKKHADEEESTPPPPASRSSFLPPDKARNMLNKVDAIVRDSWSARDLSESAANGSRPDAGLPSFQTGGRAGRDGGAGVSARDLVREVGRESGGVRRNVGPISPSLEAAELNGIEQRMEFLKRKEAAIGAKW